MSRCLLAEMVVNDTKQGLSIDEFPSGQCRIAASKGNQVIRIIRRNITFKDKSLIVALYKAIVRPHLEYCIHAWSPYLRKDIDILEKIQRRATKLIPGLRILDMKND